MNEDSVWWNPSTWNWDWVPNPAEDAADAATEALRNAQRMIMLIILALIILRR